MKGNKGAPAESVPNAPGPGGRTLNEERNARFFDEWTGYHSMVDELDSYARTAKALEGELGGRVVDVGSGGVVNYPLGPVSELVLVDLGEAHRQADRLPPRTRAVVGSACALPLPDGAHDRVLMQMLVHHLAEKDFATTRVRTGEAFSEAFRVLAPGGRLVVVESTMHPVLELAQRLAFPLSRRLLGLMNHPLVFQWSPRSLRAFADHAGFATIELTPIPRGRRMIFLGRQVPTWLVPVRFIKLVAAKAA